MNNLPSQSEAERGTELHQRLLSLSVDTTRKFFEFGEIMKEIRDDQLWLSMGYESFESYYADPELAYSKSSVYHAISLVEHFPEWRTMPPLPISKLIMIVPWLTDENKPKLLEAATGLSRSDLQHELDNLGEQKIKLYQQLPKLYWCKNCSKLKGIFLTDLCRCGWTKEQEKRFEVLITEVNNR